MYIDIIYIYISSYIAGFGKAGISFKRQSWKAAKYH